MRIIWYILGGISVFVFALFGVVVDFAVRSQVVDHTDQLPTTAFVFTGQFDRIERGLDLLAMGQVQRLFISGVNPKAGLTANGFADQFALTEEHTIWLKKGQVILEPNAHTTLQNALESACWLERQLDVQSVALVTSQRHMARASLALERAIGSISVIRVTSDPAEEHLKPWKNLNEAGKFVATWAITLMPRRLWSLKTPINCRPT